MKIYFVDYKFCSVSMNSLIRTIFILSTYHRCCTITDFLVLQLGQLNQDLGGWVLHFEQIQNCGSVIGNGYILSKAHYHILLEVLQLKDVQRNLPQHHQQAFCLIQQVPESF